MRRFWTILLALLAIRFVLMVFAPVFEPSEARYAAIAANMARSGDFVVPRFTYNFEYQSFDGKPPLVFQAGGLFVKALGTDAPWKLQLGVRLFPLISALLMLVILYHSVRRFADGERARLAVLVCASTTAFFAATGISMTDMTLTCCVAGALLLYRCFAYSQGGDALATKSDSVGMASSPCASLLYAAGVAALLGAGMITKGPVALVMFGLPVLVDAIVNHHWKAVFNWRWLAVMPVFLLVAAPWFVMIERVNPGATLYFFYNENFLRFVSHDYGDKYGAGREAFRGVSVLWALVATLPWSLFPLWELWRNRKTLNRGALLGLCRDFEVLAILSIVGFWCLTSRVLLYYLFPMIPLFAAAVAQRGDRNLLSRFVPWVAGASALVLTVGLVGGAMFSEKMQGPRTQMKRMDNHYAVEFYHGRMSDEELAPYRREYEKVTEEERLWKLKQKEGGGEKR